MFLYFQETPAGDAGDDPRDAARKHGDATSVPPRFDVEDGRLYGLSTDVDSVAMRKIFR
jgi:hypothetical protein